ncbi:hypothetical protein DRO97_09400 [Archaeoglobales archaeon]|nr:MAG: hypothetical protein DRO97_09400 [Archaeoglobales archaeon]
MGIEIGEALTKPIDIIQKNPGIMVPAVLPAIASLVFALLVGAMYHRMGLFMQNPTMLVSFLFTLIIYLIIVAVLSLVANGAIVSIAYAEISGKRIHYMDGIRDAFEKIVDLVIASIIIVVGVAVGIMLLVVPGLIFALLAMFTIQEIMIGGKGGIEAIFGSIDLVKANFRNVLVYAIVLFVVVAIISILLDLIPLVGEVIAALVLTPYTGISLTIAYTQLKPAEII